MYFPSFTWVKDLSILTFIQVQNAFCHLCIVPTGAAYCSIIASSNPGTGDRKGGKTQNSQKRSLPIRLFTLTRYVNAHHLALVPFPNGSYLKVFPPFISCASSRRQNEEPVFSKDCKVLFTTVPLKQGDHGTFNHITMISNRVKPRQTFAGICRPSFIYYFATRHLRQCKCVC